ncbi:MAG TPA: hypothetical protein VGF30_07750, partial [Bacteroidia bacterium]
MINIFAIGIGASILYSCSNEPTVTVKQLDLSAPPADSSEPAPPPSNGAVADESHALHTNNKFFITDLKDNKKTLSVNMYIPRITSDGMNCEDSTCTTLFEFEDGAYPSFAHIQALGGEFDNAGVLDGDGTCEIYFVPDWFTSSWTSLNIYSCKDGSWKKIATASIRREDFVDEKDKLFMTNEKRIIKHN